jgi:hypothetical protein
MSKINQPFRFPRALTSCEFINFVIFMVDGVKYLDVTASPLFKIATGGLESYVYELLTKRLGKWIHVTRDQLNVSGWQGEMVLEQVCIRADALRSLSLPLRVRSGHAARIRVRIPWHALRSEPMVVVVENLTLHVAYAPGGGSGFDTVVAVDADDEGGGTGGQGVSYFARIAFILLHNVQVRVSHVRVEVHFDEEACGVTTTTAAHLGGATPSPRAGAAGLFTIGLGADHVSIRAADADWQPGFVWPEAATLRRRIEVGGLWATFRRVGAMAVAAAVQRPQYGQTAAHEDGSLSASWRASAAAAATPVGGAAAARARTPATTPTPATTHAPATTPATAMSGGTARGGASPAPTAAAAAATPTPVPPAPATTPSAPSEELAARWFAEGAAAAAAATAAAAESEEAIRSTPRPSSADSDEAARHARRRADQGGGAHGGALETALGPGESVLLSRCDSRLYRLHAERLQSACRVPAGCLQSACRVPAECLQRAF